MNRKRDANNDRVTFTISRNTLLVMIGVIILFFILFTNELSAKSVGFWGSILGGIIGGIFTVLGVRQTIRYESDRTRLNEFSLTITQLLDMKKQVEIHIDELMEFNKLFRHIDWTGKVDGVIIGNPLEEFKAKTNELEFRLSQASIPIDIETYKKVGFTFNEIKGKISWNLSVLKGWVIYSEEPINVPEELDSFIKITDKALAELRDFLNQKSNTYMSDYEKLKIKAKS